MSDIKVLVNSEKPHLLGLSECELRKVNNIYDESQLKIPGYDLLFPKSWSTSGYARVLLYVKSTLHYERCLELEDNTVQSIWVRGGFKKGKKLLFCHTYGECTNSMGNIIKD